MSSHPQKTGMLAKTRNLVVAFITYIFFGWGNDNFPVEFQNILGCYLLAFSPQHAAPAGDDFQAGGHGLEGYHGGGSRAPPARRSLRWGFLCDFTLGFLFLGLSQSLASMCVFMLVFNVCVPCCYGVPVYLLLFLPSFEWASDFQLRCVFWVFSISHFFFPSCIFLHKSLVTFLLFSFFHLISILSPHFTALNRRARQPLLWMSCPDSQLGMVHQPDSCVSCRDCVCGYCTEGLLFGMFCRKIELMTGVCGLEFRVREQYIGHDFTHSMQQAVTICNDDDQHVRLIGVMQKTCCHLYQSWYVSRQTWKERLFLPCTFADLSISLAHVVAVAPHP